MDTGTSSTGHNGEDKGDKRESSLLSLVLPSYSSTSSSSSSSNTSSEQQWEELEADAEEQAVAVSIVMARAEGATRQKAAAKKRRNSKHQRTTSRTTKSFVPRIRVPVAEVMRQLRPLGFRRAYRMTYESFLVLSEMLCDGITKRTACGLDQEMSVQTQGVPAPNGVIPPSIRLAAALRVSAGGKAYDIATTFGIGVTSVQDSVWRVVDAIAEHPDLHFEFPACHNAQRKIAKEFQQCSMADFGCCVGCIDGMLVWIEQPRADSCEEACSGQKTFYCGRKNKFGLNLQAVCDSQCRFLDMSLTDPGKNADCISFESSDLYKRLETENIMAPGLCLFGDNAYINTPYMATPYRNVSTKIGAATAANTEANKQKDAYNFYHSQLRIWIEQAFGQLVH